MKHFRRSAAALLLLTSGSPILAAEKPSKLSWDGQGEYRIVVEVPPVNIGTRSSDEMPASLQINSADLPLDGNEGKPIDTSSLQIVGYDAQTGKPLPHGNFRYGKTPGEFAFRWYDDSIPWNFPDFSDAMDRTQGKITRHIRPGFGHTTSAADDGFSGRFAWLHRQEKQAASTYCIYFNTMEKGALPAQLPPRCWIGDGGIRFDKTSSSSTGCLFTRIALTDWNGDGLTDIVFGEYAGQLYWFPNLGTPEKPVFKYFKMIFDEDHNPVDVGQYATPVVADWDGDGKEDVLIGCENNRLIWYKNVGTNSDRKLRYMGFIMADGKPLEMPIRPLTYGNPDIFTREDSPVPEIADWDGDGQPDLLAGGWITGLVFFYKNMGRDADGVPKLHLVGPLECDGKLLNVQQWAASPCVGDFDGDGDLDLISGSDFRLKRSEAPPGAHASTLRYYENIGTRTNPRLTERPFPRQGGDPFNTVLARACAADLFHHGKLDLVMSVRQEIYIWPNVGEKNAPKWEINETPLRIPWGTSPLKGRPSIDYNHDGLADLEDGYDILLNSGEGNPYAFGKTANLLERGQKIMHSSGIGDDWFWPRVYDFNRDGNYDVLFGDWWGRVWYHHNAGTNAKNQIDLKGDTLKLTDGTELKVGPINQDVKKSFAALQGARTAFVACDFDEDGKTDLVVGDTFGVIRYFHNEGTKDAPVFASPVEIGNLGSRMFIDQIDWNDDGRPDVLASDVDGTVRVYLNQVAGGKMKFSAPVDPGVPEFDEPEITVADVNGDGDQDFYVDCIQGSAFVERSFLKNHGYVQGKVMRVEKRPTAR